MTEKRVFTFQILPSTLIAFAVYEILKDRCIAMNGYTDVSMRSNQSSLDHSLQVDEIEDFLEEITMMEEISLTDEIQYQEESSYLQN